jgi:hypothetical protein
MCYSYPQIELSNLILLRNGKFKFIKNELAREVQQSLMKVSRSGKVPRFNLKLAQAFYGFQDA